MRTSHQENGLSVAAYAGSTGVHLAWDLDPALRTNLLGFAFRRFAGDATTGVALRGGIGFPGQTHEPGEFLDSFASPIQAFRWGDYTVYPGQSYRYEIVPRVGPDWQHLTDGPSASVTVRTEPIHGGQGSPHSIAFNRAVAASQAYERHFDASDPGTNPAAFNWLSRDLDDLILDFLERAADSAWALDVVIYEYELEEVRAGLRAARGRGATVRLVFHDRQSTKDKQTPQNEGFVTADGWAAASKGRLTSAICHDKTVVLSRLANGTRTPVAVLTGSTNWTLNGFSYQANVAHSIDDPGIAAQYLALFERLWSGDGPAATRTWIDGHNPLPATDAPLGVVFSPRSGRHDLERYVELIDGADRTLIFATAFDLDDTIDSALLGTTGKQVLRYGLQNTASRITGYNRERATFFTAKGMLTTALPGFRAESLHGQDGNLLIHLKAVVLDFDTGHPTVMTGSANYSNASSGSNDENAVIIRGDTRVADIYMVELFRLFDHYKTRYKAGDPTLQGSGTSTRRGALDVTPAWADAYYEAAQTLHVLERTRLAHPSPT
jgi:phosphatidylserine/phosphatidylglycerophosphate/cardiolipin synthase-like enzyme